MQTSESLAALESLVASKEQTLGKNDASLAEPLQDLAAAYVQAKQLYKAETTYWRVIEVRQQAVNGKGSQLADALEALAKFYDSQFREMEADRLREWAKSISEADGDSAKNTGKSTNIFTMPIGDLLKQAGTILNTPIDLPKPVPTQVTNEAPPADPIPETVSQSPKNTNVLTMPIGDLLKQANSILNTPIGLSSKPQAKAENTSSPPESQVAPSNGCSQNAESSPQPVSSVSSGQPPLPPPQNAASRQTAAVSNDADDPLYLRWKEAQETEDEFAGLPRCPHGQPISLGFDTCALCSVLQQKQSGSFRRTSGEVKKPVTGLVLEASGEKVPVQSCTLWIAKTPKADIVLTQDDIPGSYQASINQNDDGCWFNQLSEERIAQVNGLQPENKIKLGAGDSIVIGKSFKIRVV